MEYLRSELAYQTPVSNSSLLPYLLLSILRQKHSPKTTDHFYSEYDYIVVGAGAGGATVAGRLSEEPCVSVLVLEAGKSPPILTDVPGIARAYFNTDIDWEYLTAPQRFTGAGLNNRQVAWPSGKVIGGSTIWNGMLHVRGNRKDYDNWASLGATGWSYRDVLPYFKKLEGNTEPEIVDPGFHGFHGPITAHRPRYNSELKLAIFKAAQRMGFPFPDVNGYQQEGFSDFQANHRDGQRCSTAKAYLVPADKRENLNIVERALVTKVLFDGDRAVGVHFDHKGNIYEVRARKEVIVSAGAVKTPQLLMLSGVGPREHLQQFGIPVVADLPVGNNFHDHEGAVLPFEMSDSIPSITEKLSGDEYIERYIHERAGPLASCEGLATFAMWHNNYETSYFEQPDHQVYFLEANTQVAETQFNVKREIFEKMFRSYENKTIYFCVSQILQPKSRGYIRLQSADPYDAPIIDPNYLEHAQDLRDIVEGMKLCRDIANSPEMKKIGVRPFNTVFPGCEGYVWDDDEYFTCIAKSIVITLSHPVSTTKMGNIYDPSTVVDPELRVKGLKGLRVVDASVMPMVPTGNTGVPTIMIAEKASDMIKRTFSCSRTYK